MGVKKADNPWRKKKASRAGGEKSLSSGPQFSLSTGSNRENPFSAKMATRRSISSTSSTGSRKTPKRFRWIKLGMKLRVSWAVDRAFGSGADHVFQGKVVAIDDWITLVSPLKVKCHMPLSMLTKVEQR